MKGEESWQAGLANHALPPIVITMTKTVNYNTSDTLRTYTQKKAWRRLEHFIPNLVPKAVPIPEDVKLRVVKKLRV